MMIRGKEDMKNDLTVDCTIFPLETVRIYVETIMGISKKPISLEILLDLIRFLLDFGKAEKGKNNYRLNDTITSINIGLISRFPTILNLGFQGLTFSYIAKNLNLFQLPVNSIFTWIFAFILYVDYYVFFDNNRYSMYLCIGEVIF